MLHQARSFWTHVRSGDVGYEAAMIAADIAPGLTRDYYGVPGWRGHERAALGPSVGGGGVRAAEAAAARIQQYVSGIATGSACESRASKRGPARGGRLVEFEVMALAAAAPAAVGDGTRRCGRVRLARRTFCGIGRGLVCPRPAFASGKGCWHPGGG